MLNLHNINSFFNINWKKESNIRKIYKTTSTFRDTVSRELSSFPLVLNPLSVLPTAAQFTIIVLDRDVKHLNSVYIS